MDAYLDPFLIVANALKCDRNLLEPESAMHRTHGWDSFGHLGIVMALERSYGVSISDEEILNLTDMASIVSFHTRITQAERDEN